MGKNIVHCGANGTGQVLPRISSPFSRPFSFPLRPHRPVCRGGPGTPSFLAAGGEDLQQHASRHWHDWHGRGDGPRSAVGGEEATRADRRGHSPRPRLTPRFRARDVQAGHGPQGPRWHHQHEQRPVLEQRHVQPVPRSVTFRAAPLAGYPRVQLMSAPSRFACRRAGERSRQPQLRGRLCQQAHGKGRVLRSPCCVFLSPWMRLCIFH